ncbi:hypothetical protein PMZ80_000877 [Knufia obscura]|uniref:Uncharacterized protein n=2 Tax=Knufia TaxID=430999 RepID=A0AAN8E9K5_9EURO|nr:hypothetical protein PMZ80_000877 [Knufia obscura]KAK5949859.1 hypothetical protein OHC33_009044 [Knufia fluminis]
MALTEKIYFGFYDAKTRGYSFTPATDLWKLSTSNVRGFEKGRPGRARRFKKAQALTYEGLPGEIRNTIYQYAYAANHYASLSIKRYIPPKTVTRSRSGLLGQCIPEDGAITVTLPDRIGQLFVSKTYLIDALPHFLQSLTSNIRMCSWDVFLDSLHPTPFVKYVCLTMLQLTTELHTNVRDKIGLDVCLGVNGSGFGKLSTIFVQCTDKPVWLQSKQNAQEQILRYTPQKYTTTHDSVAVPYAFYDIGSAVPATKWPTVFKECFKNFLGEHNLYLELKEYLAKTLEGRRPHLLQCTFWIDVRGGTGGARFELDIRVEQCKEDEATCYVEGDHI